MVLYKLLMNTSNIFIKDMIDIIFTVGAISVCTIFSILISRIHKITECRLYKEIVGYSFDIYILGDPLNYIILQLITILNLGYLYQSNIGSVIIIITRSIGVLIISMLVAQMIKKLKNYERFNKIIKIVLYSAIIASIIVIISNSILGIMPITYK